MIIPKRLPLLLILLFSITIVGVSGTYIAHHLTTIYTGDITIVANEYVVGLWADEEQTTPANLIAFPDIVEGRLQGAAVSISAVYYLAPNVSTMDRTLYVIINATRIPRGMTLGAQVRTSSAVEWFTVTVNDSEYDASFAATYGQRQLRFLLDVGTNTVGAYPGFQIQLYGSESVN